MDDGMDRSHSTATDEAVSSAASLEEAATAVVEDSGHFRVYLGAAAGVGKTYAMLSEGHRRKARGTDVVVGFVECHGRALTEALLEGLEVVARRVVEYRGARFEEMDLPGIVARRPEVVLVDELAHTNVPGSGPHEKRWQDVLELLSRGIDVITTVNIQHLESLADAVEALTGVTVGERVPDWVVRRADQIELVDSSPEQLRRRMLHGNIYPADQVPQALGNFFRPENLLSLRELALRFLADETEEELLAFLARHRGGGAALPSERIMVAVAPVTGMDAVLRRASRLVTRTRADFHAVNVRRSRPPSPASAALLAELRQMAIELGATWEELHGEDVARTLMEFARQQGVTQILLGASRRSRLKELLTGGSIVWKVQRLAADEDVDLHIIARREDLSVVEALDQPAPVREDPAPGG